MNQDWNCTFGGLLRRIIWLALVVGLLITVLRLMAWADTGSRGECPVERNLIPTFSQPTK